MSEGKGGDLPKDHEDLATKFPRMRTDVHAAQDSLGGKSKPLNTKKRIKPGSILGWSRVDITNPQHGGGGKSKPGKN